jgi:hypothetical protein
VKYLNNCCSCILPVFSRPVFAEEALSEISQQKYQREKPGLSIETEKQK